MDPVVAQRKHLTMAEEQTCFFVMVDRSNDGAIDHGIFQQVVAGTVEKNRPFLGAPGSILGDFASSSVSAFPEGAT